MIVIHMTDTYDTIHRRNCWWLTSKRGKYHACWSERETRITLYLDTMTYLVQSYPARALDRRLQVDWAKDAREGPRILMSLRVDFGLLG